MGDLPVVCDVGEFSVVGDDVAIDAGEEGFAEVEVSIDEDPVRVWMMGEVEVGFELAFVVGDDGVTCLPGWKVVDLLRDLAVEIADTVASGEEKSGALWKWGPALEWFDGGHGESGVAD